LSARPFSRTARTIWSGAPSAAISCVPVRKVRSVTSPATSAMHWDVIARRLLTLDFGQVGTEQVCS
jgi:hypothetical protein